MRLTDVSFTSDSAIIVTGYSLRDGTQTYAISLLIKLDLNGAVLWDSYFNQDVSTSQSNRVIEAANGDYLLAAND